MLNDLYIVLQNIILEHNKEYKYLVEYCDEWIKDDKLEESEKKEIMNYYEGLNEFYQKEGIEIVRFHTEIAYNYFKVLYNFLKYLKLKHWSPTYFSEYRIFAIRVMEIALKLQKYNIEARNIFFQKKSIEFYPNLLKIYKINFEEKNSTTTITSDAEIFKNTFIISSEGFGIIYGDNQIAKFISTVSSPGFKEEKPSLKEYLKLSYDGVYHVYKHIASSNNKTGGGGGLGVILIPLDPFPKSINRDGKIIWLEEELNNNDKKKRLKDNDEVIEAVARSNKCIISSKSSQKLDDIEDRIDEYNNLIDIETSEYKIQSLKKDNSVYKNIKLNKSIGHLSAKSNLQLQSQHNIPRLNILHNFLTTVEDNKSFNYGILIATILLGIEPRQLFAIVMGKSNDFSLVKKKYIRVKLTTAYAITTSDVLFYNTKKYVEFELPLFLRELLSLFENEIFQRLKSFIKEKKTLYGNDVINKFDSSKNIKDIIEFLEEQYSLEEDKTILNGFLDYEIKEFKRYLHKERKKYKKNIKITVSHLHLYSFHFYKMFHKESEVSHLFLKNKTSNIHTQITYVATSTKMLNMALWVKELAQKLKVGDNVPCSIAIDTDYSGSNKLVSIEEYKRFLSIIGKIKLKSDKANVTLQMIYLRYVFALLLGTRKYYFSVNLKEYSRRNNLLLIHEKAKDIYTSKRIIPITALGEKYINKFFELRDKYKLQSFSPVIVDDNGYEKQLNQENIRTWMQEHNDDIVQQLSPGDYNSYNNFLNRVVRDFGRHIFASEAHKINKTNQAYIDAFMNHFKRGTQDQGMYSSFDNQEYIRQIRLMMEIIEKKYIPFWKEVNI